MKWLWACVCLVGCTTPVQPTPTKYYIKISRLVDSIKTDTVLSRQTVKPMVATTNLPSTSYVYWVSDAYVTIRLYNNLPNSTVDTVPTINSWSRVYKGTVTTVFGAFTVLRGYTAQVIAYSYIDNKLVADTSRMVIY